MDESVSVLQCSSIDRARGIFLVSSSATGNKKPIHVQVAKGNTECSFGSCIKNAKAAAMSGDNSHRCVHIMNADHHKKMNPDPVCIDLF